MYVPQATAAATSDDELGSPMIRGHAPVPDATADAEPELPEPALPEPALLSPPLDLREPASPFIQVTCLTSPCFSRVSPIAQLFDNSA